MSRFAKNVRWAWLAATAAVLFTQLLAHAALRRPGGPEPGSPAPGRPPAPAHAATPEQKPPVAALSPYVDAHIHIDERDPEGSAKSVIYAMAEFNTVRSIVLTEPYSGENPDRWDAEKVLPALKKYANKIALMGGGGTLNPMILESARSGDAGSAAQKKFKARAEELIAEGVAGFGELSTEHFSLAASPLKDYEYAPADHPLMLLLADIAAQHNMPIDLHMEAAPQAIPLPAGLKSPPNPPRIHANIAALERLLDHNRSAKIIWAHAGSDNTGYRTPQLCDRLLRAHPNLYMEMKIDPMFPGLNYPMAKDGDTKPEWLKLLQDHPDRFIIGSDQHYGPDANAAHVRAQAMVLFLNRLPDDLRQHIGIENVLHIYGAGHSAALATPAR